ncbi:hypothetical protein B0H11DRAFT_2026158 [Mycena galericulata]|nr:hypothetical protein B0H11DRAFT_2026158 [Mycena galericulata]
MSAQCPPYREEPGPNDSSGPSSLRVLLDSAESVPNPPPPLYGAAPVSPATLGSKHHSTLFHPSHWFGRNEHEDEGENLARLISDYPALPINEFLGHSCTHLLKPDKALLKLSKAQLHTLGVSYDRYKTQELTTVGRRSLLCTLLRIEPKHHNDFMSAALRFTGVNSSSDLQMVAAHSIADLPHDRRLDATFLATELHPANVQARIDALPAMLRLERSDATFVRAAHDVCVGCSDDTLPLQVVNSLRCSHEFVLRDQDRDRRVHYFPARQPEMDALGNLWGHASDAGMRIALLIAFASVAADERVMFADACRTLHHLVEYPKLVKLVANTPASQRYARAQALALPYEDPVRIAAMRAQWPR